MSEFKEFQKIARLNREVIVTEKIDGTNAQVLIEEVDGIVSHEYAPYVERVDNLVITAGSRNRYLSLEKDNFGFARWVKEHAKELGDPEGAREILRREM